MAKYGRVPQEKDAVAPKGAFGQPNGDGSHNDKPDFVGQVVSSDARATHRVVKSVGNQREAVAHFAPVPQDASAFEAAVEAAKVLSKEQPGATFDVEGPKPDDKAETSFVVETPKPKVEAAKTETTSAKT